jgi:hypothetical protein
MSFKIGEILTRKRNNSKIGSVILILDIGKSEYSIASLFYSNGHIELSDCEISEHPLWWIDSMYEPL